MKTLTVNPQGTSARFSIPIPMLGSKLNAIQRFLEGVTTLRIFFYLFLITLLPFSVFTFAGRNLVSNEASSYIFVVLILLLIASFYSIEVIFASKDRVIDPKGSLVVLMFGLLVTAASAMLIFTDFESSANTFGLVGNASTFKTVSGLSIIAGMSVYYLTQLFIHQQKSISGVFKSLAFGLILFSLVSIFSEDYRNFVAIPFISIPFILAAIFAYSNRLLKAVGVIAFVYNIYLLFDYNWYVDTKSLLLFIFLIISLVVSYILFSFRFDWIENYFGNYFKNLKSVGRSMLMLKMSSKNVNKVLRLILFPLFFSLPILIITFAITIIGKPIVEDIFTYLKEIYTLSFNAIDSDIVTLLIGTGAGNVASAGDTLFSQIIIASGVIGVFAYILLWGFAFVQSIKNLIDSKIKNNEFAMQLAVSVYIMFFPLAAIFLVDPIFIQNYFIFSIIWWLCFGLVLGVQEKNYINFTVTNIAKSKTVFGRYFRYIFSLTLFLISYILIYTVFENIGDLL